MSHPRDKSAPAKQRALELLRSGLSLRAVEERLKAEGLVLGKSTIHRLHLDYRRADTTVRAAEVSSAPVIANAAKHAGHSRDSTAADDLAAFEAELAGLAALDDPTAVDVAELAALCRLLTRHLARSLDALDWRALRPLFEFRAQLSLTLARVRPPEKVDPAADPTNVQALHELRARLAALREPIEASPPVVAAMKAHVERLAARVSPSAEGEGDGA